MSLKPAKFQLGPEPYGPKESMRRSPQLSPGSVEYAILTQIVKTWFIRRFGE